MRQCDSRAGRLSGYACYARFQKMTAFTSFALLAVTSALAMQQSDGAVYLMIIAAPMPEWSQCRRSSCTRLNCCHSHQASSFVYGCSRSLRRHAAGDLDYHREQPRLMISARPPRPYATRVAANIYRANACL